MPLLSHLILQMQALEPLTDILLTGSDLEADQATVVAELLIRSDVSASSKRDCLLALARKGETATEVAAFAHAFREHAVNPGVEEWASRAIDVCGTGGDGSGTFNISTAVSFVVAAAGVPVFKHGNRSITSKCGSADLLEALGIRLDAPHDMLRQSLSELNYGFFFAPAYHPAFKEIMPVRRALAEEGQRTIFNLLGPLINPGRPAYQLLGVFSQAWVQPLADALGELGLAGGVVAHGRPQSGSALDELSCAGENFVAGFGARASVPKTLDVADAGLSACDFAELSGGDVAENLATMHALLSGVEGAVPAGLRDSVLLNAGVALWIAGAASDMAGGVAKARETLQSGAVEQWLQRAHTFYKQS
ncbi:MAG: anthranilate phosphoribosyltransferase [Lentimonas sp.]|jgi:anthranilate phosphoribosyltransferase